MFHEKECGRRCVNALFEREFAQINAIFWSGDEIDELTQFSLIRRLTTKGKDNNEKDQKISMIKHEAELTS